MLTESDFRNIDSILGRMPEVLCSVGRYYRYYDIKALEESDIEELKNMLQVDPGDYSAEYFYNNNSQLMKKYDIRSEYELHNLLRKIIVDTDNKVVFSRMPDIFIQCDDKMSFVENLIREFSPISVDEFVEFVYQTYGHKTSTFRALLMTYFNKYITNGMLMSDCAEFTEEQLVIMKEKLTDDIYSVSTLKQLLTEVFDVEDFRLINNLNMLKIGYKLRGNYIMKSSISNLEGYMREYINNNDYYYIKPEYRKIGSTFSSYLYKFIYSLDLFKIDEEKYITIKKLNELGITKDDIEKFVREINSVIKQNEFFNLYSLDKDNFLSNLKKYNFPDCFYETIISTIKNSSLSDDTKFVLQLGMSITQDSDSVYFDLNVYVNTVDASSVYIYKDSPILIKLSDGEILRLYCNKDVKDNIGTVFSATYNIIRYSVIANYRITPKDILKFKKGITKIRLEVNAEKCDMEFKKYKKDELGQFLLSAYSLVSQELNKQTDFEEGF